MWGTVSNLNIPNGNVFAYKRGNSPIILQECLIAYYIVNVVVFLSGVWCGLVLMNGSCASLSGQHWILMSCHLLYRFACSNVLCDLNMLLCGMQVHVPHISVLAERLIECLPGTRPVPGSLTHLYRDAFVFTDYVLNFAAGFISRYKTIIRKANLLAKECIKSL